MSAHPHLPTHLQELIIKAAFLEGRAAIDAWNEWKESISIDCIDHGSNRLLPLLYHNLSVHKVHDPLMPRLRGVYRHTQARNHSLIHHITPLLTILHDRGIEFLLLNGIALTLLYYRKYGLRPQVAVDILVREERVEETANLLQQHGWELEHQLPFPSIIRFKNTCSFNDGTDRRIDLHWHVMPQGRYMDRDGIFWEHSQRIEFNRIPARVLSPTHNLFYTLAQDVHHHSPMACFWVADALTTIRTTASSINWAELSALVNKSPSILTVRERLLYLRKTFPISIPSSIMAEFPSYRPSTCERLEYTVKSRSRSAYVRDFAQLLFEYMRLSAPHGIVKQCLDFPRFLQVRWNIKDRWQMPFVLIRRSMKLKWWSTRQRNIPLIGRKR